MVVFLLLVIIVILLFGGAAVLGTVGLIVGGIAAVVVITYVGVHYDIDHEQAFWGFIGLCGIVSVVSFYFAAKGSLKKRKERVAAADRWDEVLRDGRLGKLTAKQYLQKYPMYQDSYSAWIALGRKRPESQGAGD